jgi:hypothetical protein
VALSLKVGDVYFDDEPVVVEVTADEPGRELWAVLADSASGREVSRERLADHKDGTYSARGGPLPEGSYVVQVQGEDVVPIADSLGVSPRVS